MQSKFFIEIDYYSLSEKGQAVSGDVCLQRRKEGRSVVVLSDGAGSGIQANLVAGVIASMAVNYTLADEPVLRAAQAIVHTFGSENGSGRHATFSILDIKRGGDIHISEFDNPQYILLREEGDICPIRERAAVDASDLYTSNFTAMPEDRIILFSDGVSMSGRMTRRMPEGWGRDEVIKFCRELIAKQPTVSARDLCRKIIEQAEVNDLYAPKNDMTCAVVYFRQPRKIMVLSGPPYNEHKDDILADMVDKYKGTKLICGGTTAQIVARELGREVEVCLKRDPAGLPPTSRMQGVDLITEGVLTLSKVKRVLENSVGTEITQQGTDGIVARMLLEHDIIEFVVGTRINPRHQDPSLPVELELRRNLIRGLAELLENKFMKEVKIQYI